MMTVDFKSKRADIIRIRYTRRGDYADETGIGITSVNLFVKKIGMSFTVAQRRNI